MNIEAGRVFYGGVKLDGTKQRTLQATLVVGMNEAYIACIIGFK